MRRTALAAFAFFVSSSAFAYDFAMWIPGWGSAQLTSIQANAGALKESNPVWYGWNSDGSLRKKTNAENATWRAAMTGTLIIPTVQNTTANGFDLNAVVALLSNATARDAHAEMLTQLVIAQAYDGIDIDYERIPATQQANFSAFLTTLSTKLHAINKKLSVSVYGKVGASDTWDGAGGEDYAAIGRVADSVKLMGYDYHWSTSDAGALAPLTWLDQVATYAEATIPANKIMMGLPFYGYDWVGTNGTDVGYPQATQTAASAGATITHDANGEATFTYSGHTVFFQDATSFRTKINMLTSKHPKLGGFTMWAAGQEDPAVWPIIRTNAAASTVAPGDFAMSGLTALTVFHGKVATADYSLVAVNGFNGTATVTASAPAGFAGTITASGVAGVNTPATLAINPADTYPGTYPVTVTFTSGSLVHKLTVNVSVVMALPGTPVSSAPVRRRAAGH
jgi:spore germination protein